MSGGDAVGRAVLVALALALSVGGCTGIVEMRPLVVPPPQTPESHQARFVRVLEAARARGYEPAPVQPSRYRFGVQARYADQYSYSIAVECFSDGSVHLTPIGPRVQRNGDRTRLPVELRDEVAALGLAFARVYP